MTQERIKILTEILKSDQERAKKLLTMEAEEALAQINFLGHNFTLDEIREYGMKVKEEVAKSKDNELNLDSLDHVAGGVGISITDISVSVGGGNVW